MHVLCWRLWSDLFPPFLTAFATPFSQSNSDSDEDYILIEKEEGVAAEAAANAADDTAAAPPPAELPSLDTPSAQMVSAKNAIRYKLHLHHLYSPH